MLAGEGAAQFATLTQAPLPRQQGGAGAWPVATATLPLPAPQPPLQRSATLPISYGPKPDGKDRGRGEAPCLRSVQGQRPPTCEVSLVDCRSGCRPWSEVQGHIFRRGCRRGPHRGRRAQAGSVRQPRHLPRHWEPLLGRHLQGKGAPCFHPVAPAQRSSVTKLQVSSGPPAIQSCLMQGRERLVSCAFGGHAQAAQTAAAPVTPPRLPPPKAAPEQDWPTLTSPATAPGPALRATAAAAVGGGPPPGAPPPPTAVHTAAHGTEGQGSGAGSPAPQPGSSCTGSGGEV